MSSGACAFAPISPLFCSQSRRVASCGKIGGGKQAGSEFDDDAFHRDGVVGAGARSARPGRLRRWRRAAATSCRNSHSAATPKWQTINGLIKAAKGKQLDPTVFCAKSGGLISAENAMIAYMEKNKDWCGIPDETLDGLKANHAKSAAFAAKACKVAAELKKVKEQAANGGGPQAQPLPTGPL